MTSIRLSKEFHNKKLQDRRDKLEEKKRMIEQQKKKKSTMTMMMESGRGEKTSF